MMIDLDRWFAELDRFADVPFMEEGRQQPLMPPDGDAIDLALAATAPIADRPGQSPFGKEPA